MDKILSPITKTENIKYIRTINTDWIISQYMKSYAYDVSYLFIDIKKLDLFQCVDSGYMFFIPGIMGDSSFYAHLAKQPWYYMHWKWEHEAISNLLKEDMNVLEIGCAEGHFLEKIKSLYKCKTTGLEMNLDAISKARDKGIKIHNETIQEHSLLLNNQYDLICSFQVLEHIADVGSFIEACINCLKPDGKLIISVPNNKSFVAETDQILNMPPHHVGLWDDHSLRSIAGIYGLTIDKIILEPLQDYHLEFFKSIVYRKVLGKKYENRIIRKMYNELLLKPFVAKHLEYVTKWVPGHTILAVYTK